MSPARIKQRSSDEDAEDVALYDARKAELAASKDHTLPEAVGMLLLRGNSRLKAIRLWREMSQTDLAGKAGIGQGYLSDLESGRRAGSSEVLRTIAGLLDVPPEWITA
jgi:predicted transcriptional regulator